MLFQYILLTFYGLSAGILTAAAYITFITLLGVFSKIATKTNTGKHCILYENCIMFGILFFIILQFFINYYSANIRQNFLPPQPIGILCLITLGLFGGIYVGCLLSALAEVLNVLPILTKRTRISKKLGFIIVSIALGKAFFTIIQFFIFHA